MGDTTYGTVEIIRALEDAGIRAYVPITDWEKSSPLFGRSQFSYDAEYDYYICPNGAILRWESDSYVSQTRTYQAGSRDCQPCPLKAKCTTSEDGRSLRHSFYQE